MNSVSLRSKYAREWSRSSENAHKWYRYMGRYAPVMPANV